ncbi:MAG: hypothetical protein CM1200mP41_30590 [Gammaproteobacteria bacterium]|nr:MAG: hypothetical protein CM1200mP41_30590 [Gammaproteobacteria bacterium]
MGQDLFKRSGPRGTVIQVKKATNGLSGMVASPRYGGLCDNFSAESLPTLLVAVDTRRLQSDAENMINARR